VAAATPTKPAYATQVFDREQRAAGDLIAEIVRANGGNVDVAKLATPGSKEPQVARAGTRDPSRNGGSVVPASWTCGLSVSLPMLIAFRVIQGAVAGPMIPLSQSLLLGIYPAEKKGTALALWSMTTLVAPICGPILGGWITDNISWPWIFYINVPGGLFCGLITWQRLRSRETKTVKQPIDGVGLAPLVVGVSCLQVLLDKGEELDWFHSNVIVTLAVISAVTLTVLVVWELTDAHPIVDLRLFMHRKRRLLHAFDQHGLHGLLRQRGDPAAVAADAAGLHRDLGGFGHGAHRGVGDPVSPWVGRNLGRYDVRHLAKFSFVVFALCCFWRAGFNTGINFWRCRFAATGAGHWGSVLFYPPGLHHPVGARTG
jgi:DHA2 family multidrug resistance protein